ncbi:MAG: hypothetical protein U9N81_08695 [Bacillota bacterium]|nr:hypothetical protein [Bacillota bacterium]
MDFNKNGQQLIEKTEMPSSTHYNQKIWIVKCEDQNGHGCKTIYGVNGCDFHIRKCPNCQQGRPGELIDWWAKKTN